MLQPSAYSRIASSYSICLFLGILFMLQPMRLYAQSNDKSDVSVTLGGMIQGETTYGWINRAGEGEERDRIGFGLRRTRLLVTGRLGPKAGAFIQLEADGGTFGILDAYLMYNPVPRLRLRLGRMAGAQPRALILTPVIMMDATERAAIALLWNGGTLGSKGRSYGLDFRYLGEQIEAMLFLHNGEGNFDRLRGNYQQNIVGDVTGGIDRSLRKMAVSAYVAFRPQGLTGLEFGGHAGYNGSENPSTALNGEGRTYGDYSAHVYWGAEPGSQPVRLKADVIGVRYEALGAASGQHTLGISMLGALGLGRAAELYGRFEAYDPDLDGSGMRDYYVSAGVSFSPSRLRGRPYSQERLTLGYSARIPENDTAALNHLLVLQIQFKF